MAISTVIYDLARNWRATCAVIALAVVIGFMTSFRVVLPPGVESRRPDVGVARAAALVDTERSQAIDATAGGGYIGELRNRAVLLADLMTRSPLREEIADRAGIPRSALLTQRPMNLLEKRLTHKEVRRSTATESDPNAAILHVGVHFLVEGENPIIGVDARAHDAAAAARLADVAIEVAQSYVDRVPSAGPRPNQRLRVRQLEPATSGTARVGPSPAFSLLAFFGTLGAGCASIVLVRRRSVRGRAPLVTTVG